MKLTSERIDIIENVYFKLDKDVIEKRSYNVLENVVKVLTNHPEVKKVLVEGHTDSQGKPAYNLKLSDRRAKAVVKFLVSPRHRRLAAGGARLRPDRAGWPTTPRRRAARRTAGWCSPSSTGRAWRTATPGRTARRARPPPRRIRRPGRDNREEHRERPGAPLRAGDGADGAGAVRAAGRVRAWPRQLAGRAGAVHVAAVRQRRLRERRRLAVRLDGVHPPQRHRAGGGPADQHRRPQPDRRRHRAHVRADQRHPRVAAVRRHDGSGRHPALAEVRDHQRGGERDQRPEQHQRQRPPAELHGDPTPTWTPPTARCTCAS